MEARHSCIWCEKGLWRQNRTREHLLPVCFKGTAIPENIDFACQSCNSLRGEFYGLYFNLKKLRGPRHYEKWLAKLPLINEMKEFWRRKEIEKIGRTYVDLLDFESVINEMNVDGTESSGEGRRSAKPLVSDSTSPIDS